MIPKFAGPPDWIFFWCLIVILIIAIAKNSNNKVFDSFLQLLFTNNYLQLYSNAMTSRGIHFWMSLFFIITFSLYGYYFAYSLGVYPSFLFKEYLVVTACLLVFFVIKRGLEHLLAISFLKNQGITVFTYMKQSYLNYLSLVFLAPILVIVYISFKIPYVIHFLIALFSVLWVLSYVLAISKFRKQFSYSSFYFILYLCALELAPTCLMYLMISYGIK